MKKKKWIWLILGVMIILGFIGGKVYMDKREGQSKKELIEVERQSVKALKNTFENIKEVKVEKSVYDKVTGSYGIYVVMTDTQNNSLKFMYNFEKKSKQVYGFVIKDKSIQKRGKTKNKTHVKFSNGIEEII
ncbi:hypothetical protein ACFFIF_10745 [Vagococcus entomophilus]|uniref:DUF1310 domain-containing protein n=1 Tax=Vagococcus entomophilus TaxID=1160095 RepID=A0A430AF16_9ENTE|nr:hypothetical protein [Vagococcus entomophilus]RSU06168.1 hypothetical protein CBF30_10650 [Vagococcus entomophilus]